MHSAIHKQRLNFRMLFRVIGWLLLVEAAFMLVPLATSLIYHHNDWVAFSISAGITAIAGIFLARYSRPTIDHLGKRDAFLLTAMVWVIFSVFGQLPFLFCEHPLSLSDAFFEAMSGFTTTGASVIVDSGALSYGIHIWRALMQWIGGMGIILFTLAIIPVLNHSGGMQMFNAEVTGITHDKIRPRISSTAKSLWLIYTFLTLLLIILLAIGPMNIFDSICYALGTISTGGYSSTTTGVNFLESSTYVKIVIAVFMFLGGVNFVLLYKSLRGEFSALCKNEVFRTYSVSVLVLTMLFIISIVANGAVNDFASVTVDPLFQVISAMTTTGFALPNLSSWGYSVIAMIMAVMFFGACAGSTSGGAKLDRGLFLYKHIRNELYRCLYPHSIMSVKTNNKVVSSDLVSKVMAFFGFYVLLIVLGGVILSAMGISPAESFFSAFSCMTNTGFGIGVVGGGYELFPVAAKWLLTLLMLIGRLEIFTVLVLLIPSFWKR